MTSLVNGLMGLGVERRQRYDLADGQVVALVTAIIRIAVEDLCKGRQSARAVPFRARNRAHRRDHKRMVEAHEDAAAFFKNGRLPKLLKCAGLQETLDPELIRERAFRQAGVPFKRIDGKVVAL